MEKTDTIPARSESYSKVHVYDMTTVDPPVYVVGGNGMPMVRSVCGGAKMTAWGAKTAPRAEVTCSRCKAKTAR